VADQEPVTADQVARALLAVSQRRPAGWRPADPAEAERIAGLLLERYPDLPSRLADLEREG
jgi:hypothetical protein